MRTFSCLTVLVWMLACGCEDMPRWKWSSDEQPTPAHEEAPKPPQDDPEVLVLRERITELENERAVLQGELKHLRRREEIFAQEVKDLRFANKQQARQIEVLRRAPVERDHYKAQVEELTARIKRLEEKLAAKNNGASTPGTEKTTVASPASSPASDAGDEENEQSPSYAPAPGTLPATNPDGVDSDLQSILPRQDRHKRALP